ncbi:hypothetical protein Glove_645g61 [Diversispora epigaea]|uniref:Uncharacterized protein n=1 Tax=Diversispora epigaea TaxID=1348612 RepID=A0A397G4B9_9GLOM|nr:hypothetical protein Glove_645g61 [Diversispora epigaea]
MFKVDGAEYAFSTWFATSIELDLINIILNAKSEYELAEEVFWQCLFLDYLEEEIDEKIELAVQNYREKNKGNEDWLKYVRREIKQKTFEAGMTEGRAQKILNAIDNGEFVIRVKFIQDNSIYRSDKPDLSFKIVDKYEPI